MTADSPTLAAAIGQLTEAEARDRQRILAAKTAEATTNAMLIEAETRVQKILKDALAQSNQVFLGSSSHFGLGSRPEPAKAGTPNGFRQRRSGFGVPPLGGRGQTENCCFLASQAQETTRQASNQVAQALLDAAAKAAEEKVKQIAEDALALSNRMFLEFQQRFEAQQRERDVFQASNKVETAKTAVVVQTVEEETLKVQLRKKASAPATLRQAGGLRHAGLLANLSD